MKKKIFLTGKVYDLASTSTQDIVARSYTPYNCLFTTKNRTCIICISYNPAFNILVKSHIASFVLRRKHHPLIYLFLTFCKHNAATNTHFSRKTHEKATFFQFAAATN